MGLDMYLTGQKFFWDFDDKDKRYEDGLRIKSLDLELGYWRKHPNLHGYIVQSFAEGKDKCQEIHLSAIDLRNIISAVKERRLPPTEGFFFGQSMGDDAEMKRDLEILERALAWVEVADSRTQDEPRLEEEGTPLGGFGMTLHAVKIPKTLPKESRKVIYQASW